MKRFLLSFLLVMFTIIASQAQTNVSDTLTTSTTWTLANSPYQVTGTVTVASGVTLTIEPGVEVQFNSGTSLLVNGALVADGTETDKILFTSSASIKSPGDWNTIRFNNNSNVGSVIDHVILEYGGAGTGGALISYTTGAYAVDITNSVFQYSNLHGIDLRASSPDIFKSTFRDNGGYGIFSDLSLSYTVDSSMVYRNTQGGIRVPINASPTITASTIDTNGVGIFMDNGSTAEVKFNSIRGNNIGVRVIEAGSNSPLIEDNSIEGNTTWGLINEGASGVKAEYNYWGARSGPSNLTNPAGIGDDVSNNVDFDPWLSGTANLPTKELTLNFAGNDTLYADTVYVVANNISLATNDTLYIEPGTNIKFQSGRYLTINGTMYADGKQDSVIAFTSITDDVYGGDTNGDGRNSMPSPGEWNYLSLTNSGTSSVLNYVNVRYAGSGGTAVNIESPSVQLKNMFVDNNSRTGVRITAVPEVFQNIVSNANGNHGFEVSTSVDIKNVVAQRNQDHGLFVNVGSGSSFTVSIDSSEFSYNSRSGVYIDNYSNATAVVDSVTNSTMSHNGDYGFDMTSGNNSSLYFANNTIESNNLSGAHIYTPNASTEEVEIVNNSFLNNKETGLRTTQARMYGNNFEGNEFGLGIWGPVNFNFTNLTGTDDNTFANNDYQNALELLGRGLKGTLSAELPAGIASGSYMYQNQTSYNVEEGDTLTIEPGTVIKMLNNQRLWVRGLLIADGTEVDPITFTSYRDDTINGNNNPVTDTTSADKGDYSSAIVLDDNTNSDTEQSLLDHVIVKYARTGIEIYGFITYTNDFTNLTIQNSSNHGIVIHDATLTIDNALIENNDDWGIYARSYQTSLPTGELTVRNSIIRNNGDQGIETFRGPSSSYIHYALKELSNSTITGNNTGVKLNYPASAVSILGNTISNNNEFGLWIFHRDMDREDISIAGNTFADNGQAGVRSSAAKFIDNTFDGNEFGISQHGKLGYRYVDDIGNDGNIFTNNTYNNAIELYQEYLKDTLSANFPDQITSGVYMLSTGSRAIDNGDTLNIDPGVIIKGGHDGRSTFHVYNGILKSLGTNSNPVVFTSYRDDNFGGKTSAVGDTVSPKPYDWNQIYFDHSSGENTKYSDLSNMIIKYGGDNIYYNGGEESIVPTWNNLHSSNAYSYALSFYNTEVTIDSSSFTNSRNGIEVRNYSGSASTSLTLRNSVVSNNQDYGIRTNRGPSSSYKFGFLREVSNTEISNNGREGIYAVNAPAPMTFQFNDISNNGLHGLFATVTEEATSDTVLTIAGNRITNNAGTGILSSRANIVSDTLEGNEYPIGVTGIISKPNTINDQGNFYQDNVIQDNKIDSVINLRGIIQGVLGGTKPAGYTNNIIVVNEGIRVNSGDSLVVSPGTIVKFNGRHSIDNEGTFLSMGEVDNKIVFTSFKDDTYGGNTNRDTTGVVPEPSDWYRIYFNGQSTDSSIVKNTIVRYSQYGLNFNNSDALVDSSAISYAYSYGLSFDGSSSGTVRSSDIHNNNYGVNIGRYSSGSPVFHLNNFYDNENGAMNKFNSNTIMAENNYWGDPTGPLVDKGSDQNLNGQGDYINVNEGAVDYRPFLTGRNGILLGDVTENGTISAFDASSVLQQIVGSISLSGNALAAADVTGNGDVSAMDASYILQFVVGNISGFPGQGKRASYDMTEAIALSYEVEDDHVLMNIENKEDINILSNEFDVVLPGHNVKSVELAGSDFADVFSMDYRIDGDTIRVALAANKVITKSGVLASLSFNFEEEGSNEGTRNMSFNKFMINETDITEFVNQTYTSNEELLGDIPVEFDLKQNYPNPFNPSTNIAYDLPVAGQVKIQVFNILGQLVQTVVDTKQKAGRYKVSWDASRFSSGTYLLRIDFNGDQNKNYSQIRKMLLIK